MYDKNNLKITFTLEKCADLETLMVQMLAQNYSNAPFVDFLFEAAVPKVFHLNLMSPSGTVINPSGQITQMLRITNPNKVFKNFPF